MRKLRKQIASRTFMPQPTVLATPSNTLHTESGDNSRREGDEVTQMQSSGSYLSPATSDSSNQATYPADLRENQGSGEDAGPPQASFSLDVFGPSGLKGYILFGVYGSKRLRSPRTHLAQIDVAKCKNDDGFFDEMRVQYKALRGSFRWLFSIWQFDTCEFVAVCTIFLTETAGRVSDKQ